MIRYFHLYNRGIEKRTIFSSVKDKERFITTIRICRLTKSPKTSDFFRQLAQGLISPDENLEQKWGPALIDVLAYCLMPNHFHLEVKELINDGASKFAQRLGNSYTLYFNIKYERVGRLFETSYKSVKIQTDEQLTHLSRYIHINPIMSSKANLKIDQLKDYPWTSLPVYLGKKSEICQPEDILGFFKNSSYYWKFVKTEAQEGLLSPNLLFDSTSNVE